MPPGVLALSQPGRHSRASPVTARVQEADKAEGTVEKEEYLALAFRMGIEELVMENNNSGKDAIRDPRVVALMDLATHAALHSWVAKQVLVPLLATRCVLGAGQVDEAGVPDRSNVRAHAHANAGAALDHVRDDGGADGRPVQRSLCVPRAAGRAAAGADK